MPASPAFVNDIDYVLAKLGWMRERRIWPNGLRYRWTDAFGVVLLVSLYEATRDDHFLDEARWLVAEVNRVLGRPRGIRIGVEPDRDGQYFHYLAMWLYALAVLARHIRKLDEEGLAQETCPYPHAVQHIEASPPLHTGPVLLRIGYRAGDEYDDAAITHATACGTFSRSSALTLDC